MQAVLIQLFAFDWWELQDSMESIQWIFLVVDKNEQ